MLSKRIRNNILNNNVGSHSSSYQTNPLADDNEKLWTKFFLKKLTEGIREHYTKLQNNILFKFTNTCWALN